jgi:hypothetical protein
MLIQVCFMLKFNLILVLYSLDQFSALSPVSNSYHLLDINNERRLIVRCGMTITNYHISKLFDLVPSMEECAPLTLNTFNERK